MLRNYKFIIAATAPVFRWERQPGRDTIQLESVLTRPRAVLEITGAGRNDAGVHARAMAANAQRTGSVPEEIRDYMNAISPTPSPSGR